MATRLPGLFRKEAMSKFLRTDAPGALITIAPPWSVVVLATMALLFVGLALLAVLGRAQMVAEGRGTVWLDEPPIVLHAPFSGTVLAVQRGLREHGRAGDLLLTMDVHAETAAHDTCSGEVASERKELADLERRLTDWNGAVGREHDASMALVLIAQIRAQRERVGALALRCDALGTTVERSRVVFPVDADVSSIAVVPGAQVHEGDVLATLRSAGAKLVGYVQLPERYRSELEPAQRVRLRFDALPSDEVGVGAAHITRLLDALPAGVKLDAPESGGVSAEVEIDAMPTGSGPPRAAMTFTAAVLTRRTSVLSLLFGGGTAG